MNLKISGVKFEVCIIGGRNLILNGKFKTETDVVNIFMFVYIEFVNRYWRKNCMLWEIEKLNLRWKIEIEIEELNGSICE